NFIGQAYSSKTNYELALKNYETALELQLKYNPDNLDLLSTCYHNIGLLHKEKKGDANISLALKYYEAALQLGLSSSERDECLIATTINNITTLRPNTDPNQIDNSIENLKLVLDIRSKYLPEAHPLIGITHSTLGEAYCAKGDYSLGSKHFEQSLKIKQKYLPENHPSIIITYFDIARLYLDKGHLENIFNDTQNGNNSFLLSLHYYQHILQSTSPNYENIALIYNNMGLIHTRMNQFEKAFNCLQFAKNIYDQYLPSDHINLGAWYKNMGKVYTFKGDYQQGLDYYKKALEFYHTITTSEKEIYYALIYFNIGELYELSHNFIDALEYYQISLELVSKIQPSTHKDLLEPKYAIERLKKNRKKSYRKCFRCSCS
ncbi:unnamed protein product, partial [Didymodactylos carnosus]